MRSISVWARLAGWLAALTLSACGQLSAKSLSIDSNTGSSDSTAPTVATPTLSTSLVFASSVFVYWTAASDNVTAAADLRYQLYVSTSNNISTVADIQANGTAVSLLTSDLTAIDATGLLPTTLYYFNVLVEDAKGNMSVYTPTTATTPADTTPPAPGGAGAIATGSTTTTSTQLTWTISTDDVTLGSNLTYQVYKSTSNNIDALADVLANGTAVGTSTANINSLTVTGLTTATQYYFNIVVTDDAGNQSAYTSATVTTN